MNRYACVLVVAAVLIISCAQNQPPVIDSVKAFPESVGPADSADLMVSASDPENGRLKYKWTTKDGKLSSDKDSVVTWYAPDKPGDYKITVKVTDPKGATVSKTLDMKIDKPSAVYSGSLGQGSGSGRPVKADKTARQPKKSKNVGGGNSPGGSPSPKRGTRGTKGP